MPKKINKTCTNCGNNKGGRCVIAITEGCDDYDHYISKYTTVVCPNASTCIAQGKYEECFDDTFEDDEPCPAYINPVTMPELIKLKEYPIDAKVKIRTDLEQDTKYGSDIALSGMVELAGQIVTIKRHFGHDKYFIDEYGWSWTTDMFDGMLTTKENNIHEYREQEDRNIVHPIASMGEDHATDAATYAGTTSDPFDFNF